MVTKSAHHNDRVFQFPAFGSPGWSILRTFVMMTGEMEYDSYFIPEKLNEQTTLYYPESTLIMFVVFVIVVPIVFMNLLVCAPEFLALEMIIDIGKFLSKFRF